MRSNSQNNSINTESDKNSSINSVPVSPASVLDCTQVRIVSIVSMKFALNITTVNICYAAMVYVE